MEMFVYNLGCFTGKCNIDEISVVVTVCIFETSLNSDAVGKKTFSVCVSSKLVVLCESAYKTYKIKIVHKKQISFQIF